MPCVFHNLGCFRNFVGLTTWFMISVTYYTFVELWLFFFVLLHTTVCIRKWLLSFIICSIVLFLITVLPLIGFLPQISIVSIFFFFCWYSQSHSFMLYYLICVHVCNKVSEFAVGCLIVCRKNGFRVFISLSLYLLCIECVLFGKYGISVSVRHCGSDTENSG